MAKGAKGGNIYGKGGGNQTELTYAPNKGTALLNDPNSAAQSTNGSLIPFSDEPMPNYYRQRIDINAPTKNLNKEYGREQDYIEFHVYDIDDNLLSSDYDFKNVSFGDLSTNTNLYSSLEFNPQFVLNSKGFYTGQYRIVMNIQRKKIIDKGNEKPFTIKEISTDKTEIKAVVNHLSNEILETYIRDYINEINSSIFFKDFSLNFGNDVIIPCINLKLNKLSSKFEVYFKAHQPLPPVIDVLDVFSVAEDITDRIVLDIDLGIAQADSDFQNIKGPNFRIDTRLHNSIPSGYKNYDELLDYQITSSYENLLNKLENRDVIDIKYDYIKPVSESYEGESLDRSYHFDNFIHFSSATERIKNFRYKLELIELYEQKLSDLNSITGQTALTSFVIDNKDTIYKKKEKIIKGFDGYENFLYYDNSTSFATYPKRQTTEPEHPEGFTRYSISSSQALEWFGSEKDTDSNYGGQLLSASLFDRENQNILSKTIPDFIVDNSINEQYKLFVHMIGHHFDQIWTYIKHITKINDTHHTRGVSKDLVYLVLKSLGVETFDQFENSNLVEYILGQGTSYSAIDSEGGGGVLEDGFIVEATPLGVFDAPAFQTMVTASNEGSLPKNDIVKNIWKRLYHNAPFLLKTKGTERGLKAIMSCYGIPSSMLNVKEFGGPTRDKTTYKTFTYDKSSVALKVANTGNNGVIHTPWPGTSTGFDYNNVNGQYSQVISHYNPGNSGADTDLNTGSLHLSSSAKTITFRIRPTNLEAGQTDVGSGVSGNPTRNHHLFTLYSTFDAQSLILEQYDGSDISSSGDADIWGRLKYFHHDNTGGDKTATTAYFPAFNGDFWNIFIGTDGVLNLDDFDDTDALGNVFFGAYQANFNKHIHHYTGSYEIKAGDRKNCWGDPYLNGINAPGGTRVYFGGFPSNTSPMDDSFGNLKYSGSLQEIRYYYHQSGSFEMLTHETLTKHALTPFMYSGNHPSSSYNELIFRMPLGANQSQSFETFHPDIDQSFVQHTGVVLDPSTSDLAEWEQIDEVHHLVTPDTVGRSTTNKKVRIDTTATVDDDWLALQVKSETSMFDSQPPDYEDLGVYFSPTNEINEDIIYTLGGFRLDDYIGSPLPSHQTSSYYPDLKTAREWYTRKVKQRYNYWDYIKLIQQVDHTLFKLIEQFVPAKANLKTGLLIEPHYLERTKFPREIPTKEDQTHLRFGYDVRNLYLSLTGSSVTAYTAPDIVSEYFPIFTITFSETATAQFTMLALANQGGTQTGPTITLTSTPTEEFPDGLTITYEGRNLGQTGGLGNGDLLDNGNTLFLIQSTNEALGDAGFNPEQLCQAINSGGDVDGNDGNGHNGMINASFEPLAGNFQVTLIQAFAGETGNLSISHGNNSVGGSDFSNITTGGMPSAFAGGTGPFDETGGILGQSALEDTVTTYTFPLVEQGTNVTMPIYSYESGSGVILNQTPNLDYNAEFCQAPISPYTGTQPENYMAFTSNVLLGNATRAKKSSRYYHRVVNGNETDF